MIALPETTGSRKARIEIIPLIDVIFFLLATFVLFTLSLDKLKVLDVTLPKTSPPHYPPPPENLVAIQASADGTFYWQQGAQSAEFITLPELAPKLATYAHSTDDPRVIVRGDSHAKFGSAVLVLDEVRKARIAHVSVETHVSAT